MRENPKPFERYRHFKGNLYQIITLAKDSETMEELVVYQAMYGDYQVYVRPLEMFMSRVDKTKYPDINAEYRFERECGSIPAYPVTTPVLKTVAEPSNEPANKPANEPTNEPTNPVTTTPPAEDYESQIDPAVLEFLEADTYEEKLRVLVSVRSRITNEMINTMAVASDIEVVEGPVETRYEQLKNCLLTLEKYECNRMR